MPSFSGQMFWKTSSTGVGEAFLIEHRADVTLFCRTPNPPFAITLIAQHSYVDENLHAALTV